MRMHRSCGLVIYRLERGIRKYLLLHYPEGHWDFAKGHMEKWEREEETALREAREETGLSNLTVMHGFRDTIRYTYRVEGETISKSVVLFIAATRRKSVKISSEHIGYAWMDFEKARRLLTFENAKKIIAKADKFVRSKEDDLVRKI